MEERGRKGQSNSSEIKRIKTSSGSDGEGEEMRGQADDNLLRSYRTANAVFLFKYLHVP